jgi:hypothetical protein
MNIAQLSEHLKDIPQNTLLGYAQNPNSVVPQFLALAEIQRRQQLQGATQPPQSTVANDVLTQANPQPVAQMQQPMPPQGIAQLPQQPAPQQMAQQLPENQPGVSQLPSGMPQGMAAGGIVAFAGGGQPVPEAETDEEYQDYLDKAESSKRRSGLSEMFAGLKDRVAGVVGSLPQTYEKAKTTASEGIASLKPNSNHPYAQIAMEEAKKLGIDPKYIMHMLHKETGNLKNPESAVSHAGARGPMQLMPGTAKELGVDINDPEANTRGGVRYFAKMMDMFGNDPQLAMAAYNAGPGRVRDMLKSGRGIESLSKETQGYVRMAQGGITKLAAGDQISVDKSLSPGESIVPDAIKPTVERSPFLDYLDQLKQERADVNKQHDNDFNLALMQAGLGMMAGTSPYALANIGQGGSQGVAAYGASQKQKAAELAALRKSQLGTMEAQHLYDYRQDQLKSLDENRQERLKLGREKLTQAGDLAKDAAQQKRLGLINSAIKNAANDDDYQLLAKTLVNTPENDPQYAFIRQKMEAIKNSYIQTALGGKYVAPVFPQYQEPVEEPGFLKDIFTKAGQKIFGGPSAAPSGAPVGTYVQGKGIVYNQ